LSHGIDRCSCELQLLRELLRAHCRMAPARRGGVVSVPDGENDLPRQPEIHLHNGMRGIPRQLPLLGPLPTA